MPLRTEIRRVSDAELAQLNQQRPAEAQFSSPDETVELLVQTTLTRFSPDELILLTEHPDELVRIALVQMLIRSLHRSDARSYADRHAYVWQKFAERAVQEANDENVLWTPLLDACVDGPEDYSLKHCSLLAPAFEQFCHLRRVVQEGIMALMHTPLLVARSHGHLRSPRLVSPPRTA